jgi:hypothetical protein
MLNISFFIWLELPYKIPESLVAADEGSISTFLPFFLDGQVQQRCCSLGWLPAVGRGSCCLLGNPTESLSHDVPHYQ